MNRLLVVAATAVSLLGPAIASAQGVDKKAIVTSYANIAHAAYEDSLIAAKKLKTAIDKFLASPDAANLKAARDAWIAARVPYQGRRPTVSAILTSTSGKATSMHGRLMKV
jgi:putative iron-regulated protein